MGCALFAEVSGSVHECLCCGPWVRWRGEVRDGMSPVLSVKVRCVRNRAPCLLHFLARSPVQGVSRAHDKGGHSVPLSGRVF